jgi:HNH endonuclease
MMIALTSDHAERFWAKVHKRWSGCWEWTGATTKPPSGGRYGSFTVRIDGRKHTLKAHRVAWLLSNGDPGDQDVLHSCDNTLCVRPSHLFLGDHIANMRDMIAKGRWRGAAAENAGKTHCKHGHKLSDNNLYIHKNIRSCRTCRLHATQRYRERKMNG